MKKQCFLDLLNHVPVWANGFVLRTQELETNDTSKIENKNFYNKYDILMT